tara:strand:- start:655 stop:1185 length:531 start_codon:yes stop_codon:yes gene_type:complete
MTNPIPFSNSRLVWSHDKLTWSKDGKVVPYTRDTPDADEEAVKIHLLSAVRKCVKKGIKGLVLSYVYKEMSKKGYNTDTIELAWSSHKDEVMDLLFTQISKMVLETTSNLGGDDLKDIEEQARQEWLVRPVVTNRQRTAQSANTAYMKQQIRAKMKTAKGKELSQLKAILKQIDGV